MTTWIILGATSSMARAFARQMAETGAAMLVAGRDMEDLEALATDPDNEYALIDATIVRAHQHSAGAKGGAKTEKQLVAAKAD